MPSSRPFIFLLIFSTFLSCRDKEEQIPAYLKLEPFEVASANSAADHKLSYAFVYIKENTFLGGFPVPGLIPILEEGDIEVQIFPGIQANGSKQTPSIYPMMQPYKTKLNFVAGQTTTLKTPTDYFPNVKTVVGGLEDFDGATVLAFDDKDNDPSTSLVFDTIGGIEGKYARMQIDTGHLINWVQFRQAMEGLPTNGGNAIYIELSYKTDTPFEILLFGSDQNAIQTELIPVFQFNTSEQWNKIYIELTDFVSFTRYQKYHLQFRAILPIDFTTGKYLSTNGSVYLDNIRVVYF
jgi:hypothetical protein